MIKPIRIEKYRETGVKPNGDVPGGGNVYTKKLVYTSAPKGGCGMTGCNCSPGHWLHIGNGRTPGGVVSGKSLHFKSRADLMKYISENGIKITGRRK